MEAFSAYTERAGKASFPSRQARVITTARLHFGFLDPSGRGKHPFGSFGLSLDRPKTRLVLTPARALQVSGPERARALRYLKSIAQSCGIEASYKLHVDAAIPPHAGLGSGTQLALAVGSAFAALEDVPLDPEEIAVRLGRGARSGIGIATFTQGGAVLDGGPGGGRLPELVRRLPFPSKWRVLLIFDENAKGLAGPSETAAFAALPDFPESKAAELRSRVADGALPALAASDFPRFCAAVGYLQAQMGAYFAPLQGGLYTSPWVSEALRWLRAQGLTGLGQSSWGPTGFAFVASEAEGLALLERLRAEISHPRLSFDLAKGRNEGAKIETSPNEIR
jgi:beta-ribofuranosylaminobenzene 5'-phosphate synthase